MKKKFTLSEQELLVELRKKTNLGFLTICSMYGYSLHGAINLIIHDEEESADALQQVYVKIWNKIEYYDESKGKLYTWMLNVAKNYAKDVLRTKRFKNRKKETDLAGVDSNNSSFKSTYDTSVFHDRYRVKKLVADLPMKYQQAVDMVYLKEYSHQETAELLNIPLGTIKTRVRVGIVLLRKTLFKELGINDVPFSLQAQARARMNEIPAMYLRYINNVAQLLIISLLFTYS